MSSLKGYIPTLARLLSTTPAALYERQRALVRSGLLAQSDGRGPGSGVRATNGSIALLLITILATDSLSETNERTITIGAAKAVDGVCPLTKMPVFSHAIATILTSAAKSSRVADISVVRTNGIARIRYRERTKLLISEFRATDAKAGDLNIEAALSGLVLQAIAKDVIAMIEGGA